MPFSASVTLVATGKANLGIATQDCRSVVALVRVATGKANLGIATELTGDLCRRLLAVATGKANLGIATWTS